MTKAVLGFLLVLCTTSFAEERTLSSGSFELGLAGSLTAMSGTTQIDGSMRGNVFFTLGSAWLDPGLEVAYAHVREHDVVDLLANVGINAHVHKSSLFPFVALTGGVRQEWQGSFREARYPVGGSVGLRSLVGKRAAFRTEYRALRILDDPVASYTEHQLRVGLSIFFGVQQ